LAASFHAPHSFNTCHFSFRPVSHDAYTIPPNLEMDAELRHTAPMAKSFPQTATRARRLAPPVAKQIAATARAIFKARGFQQDHILRHWVEIVGPSLAEMSLPEKLAFPRKRGEDKNRRAEGGLLTVRVDGPASLEFAHQEPQILERINGYYGYRAVTRLKLLQAPLPLPKTSKKRQIAELNDAEEAELRSKTAEIASPELKASLESLGRKVLGSAKKTTGSRR
jgi:hypothetical protein